MSIAPFIPVTREAAAKALDISLSSLDNMIADGVMPAPRTLGGRRLYWHPNVFYGWLNKGLLPDDLNVPECSVADQRSSPAQGGHTLPQTQAPTTSPRSSADKPRSQAVQRAQARNAARVAGDEIPLRQPLSMACILSRSTRWILSALHLTAQPRRLCRCG